MCPTYGQWNNLLAGHFFVPSFADRPVYLQVDSETLQYIGNSAGIDPQRAEDLFVQGVRSQLCPSSLRPNPFWNFEKDTRLWRSRKGRPDLPPPFIGILGLCVLAASKMASEPELGVTGQNYYYWLNDLLGWKRTGTPRHIATLTAFWEELNKWLDKTNKGALGWSTARTFSNLTNVGFPISQAVLRRVDRQKLPDYFQWASLEPREKRDPEELIPSLQVWVQKSTCRLSSQGKRAFQSKTSGVLEQAVGIVANELSLWDGEASDTDLGSSRNAAIDIRLEFMRGGRQIRCTLFPRAPQDFPSGLYKTTHAKVQLTRIAGLPWFEGLPDQDLNLVLKQDFILRNGEFALYLKPELIRPFREHLELGGWVACNRVEFGVGYWLLCEKTYQYIVRKYLADHAHPGWHEVADASWLPAGWTAFRNVTILAVPTDVPEELECLVPRIQAGIRLIGGLKVDRDLWLKGGEPKVVVTLDRNRPLPVTIDGRPITLRPEDRGIIEITALDLNVGQHEIQVGTQRRSFSLCNSGSCMPTSSGMEYLAYKIFHSTGSLQPLSISPQPVAALEEHQPNQLLISGARIAGAASLKPMPIRDLISLPHGWKRYVLLGRYPGQIKIIEPPAGPLPYWVAAKIGVAQNDLRIAITFDPEWLIRIGRKGKRTISAINVPNPPKEEVTDSAQLESWILWVSKSYYNLKQGMSEHAVWEEYRQLALKLARKQQ